MFRGDYVKRLRVDNSTQRKHVLQTRNETLNETLSPLVLCRKFRYNFNGHNLVLFGHMHEFTQPDGIVRQQRMLKLEFPGSALKTSHTSPPSFYIPCLVYTLCASPSPQDKFSR